MVDILVVAGVAFVAIVLAWELFQKSRRKRPALHRSRSHWRHPPRQAGRPSLTVVPTSAAGHLDSVMTAAFEPKRLMSPDEYAVFVHVERAAARLAPRGARVMAQVCLGECLRTKNDDAFHAINSKRVDILLISSAGYPLAAIEYQGEGHYQGTAHARDAVKRAALHSAGIAYVEITPQHSPHDIEREIARALEARAVKAVAAAV